MSEQEAGVATGAGDFVAGCEPVAVLVQHLENGKDEVQDIDAGKHEVLFGMKDAFGEKVGGDGVCAGDVTGADVFGEGACDEFRIVCQLV